MRREFALAVALVACSSSGATSSSSGGASGAPTSIGAVQHGEATYYAATGAGACSFPASPNDLDVAAMNVSQWAGSAVCGDCVQVTGPNGGVTVRIVDECPDCDPGQLDLSEQAFAKISPTSAGRVKIDWQVVRCAVTGPVAYAYKDGSSQWWTAIQVRNHALPITSLEIASGGTWTSVKREDYNYFVDANGAGTGPVRVRITAIDGQQLEDTLSPVVAGAVVQGAAQFK